MRLLVALGEHEVHVRRANDGWSATVTAWTTADPQIRVAFVVTGDSLVEVHAAFVARLPEAFAFTGDEAVAISAAFDKSAERYVASLTASVQRTEAQETAERKARRQRMHVLRKELKDFKARRSDG